VALSAPSSRYCFAGRRTDGYVLRLDFGRETAQCLSDCLSKTGVVGIELDTQHGADPPVLPRQAYEIFTHEFHGLIVANSGLV
jgi:hypothetical protein